MPLSNELIYDSTPTSGFAVGDLIYSKSGSAVSGIADVAMGNVLLSGGVGAAPTYGKVTSGHVDSTVAILPGRSGGQTLNGDTVGGGSLTLSSTAHATKGNIAFGTSVYDEANNRLGLGTSSPSHALDLTTTATTVAQFQSTGNTPYIYIKDGAHLKSSSAFGYIIRFVDSADAIHSQISAASGLDNTMRIGTLTTDSVALSVNSNDRFTVDSSGDAVLTGHLTAIGLTISGNQSAAAWTTNGIRIVETSGTLTDTSSSGTVATAYTNKLGGNTIAASSATTFTNYISSYFSDPIAQAPNVTMTNKWALGADSLRIGTSNHFTVTNAGVVSANTLGVGIATPDGTLHVNRGSAGSVASSAYATITQESSDGTANDFQYLSPNTAQQRILFGDVDDNDVGMIRYIHSNNSLDIITNTATAININSTQDVGIGASAATAQKLLVSKTNAANTTGIGIKSTLISSATANGTYYGIALDFDLSNMSISTGVTDSGYRAGVRGDAYAGTANFLGTLAAQYGVWGRAGISVCGTGGTVTSAYGLKSDVLNDHASGTITNAYGLYIDNSRTTGTITNRWGVYVDTGSLGKNYFSNNVGIAITAPTALMHLGASTTARAPLCIPAGTAPTSPVSGDMWNDGTNLKFRDGATTRTITWT